MNYRAAIAVLRSTYVFEQLLFSIDLSILTFDFDLILCSFLTFCAMIGYYWGRGRVQEMFCGLLI